MHWPCAARIFQLLDEQSQTADSEQAVILESDGRVDLNKVSFRYVPERPSDRGFYLRSKTGTADCTCRTYRMR